LVCSVALCAAEPRGYAWSRAETERLTGSIAEQQKESAA
jgi:hypothetical protein